MATLLKYLLPIVISGWHLTTNAQSSITNLTFNVRDTNAIFAGIENRIKVSSKKNSKLVARYSTVKKINDTLYEITVNRQGSDTFDLVLNNKSFFKKVFYIKELTQGRFFVGAIRKNTAAKEEIVANQRLVYRNTGCNCNIPYRIAGYTINITSNNIAEADKQIVVEGDRLNEKAISMIRRLGRNDIIKFDGIVALLAYGCPRSYEAFSMQID